MYMYSWSCLYICVLVHHITVLCSWNARTVYVPLNTLYSTGWFVITSVIVHVLCTLHRLYYAYLINFLYFVILNSLSWYSVINMHIRQLHRCQLIYMYKYSICLSNVEIVWGGLNELHDLAKKIDIVCTHAFVFCTRTLGAMVCVDKLTT